MAIDQLRPLSRAAAVAAPVDLAAKSAPAKPATKAPAKPVAKAAPAKAPAKPPAKTPAKGAPAGKKK